MGYHRLGEVASYTEAQVRKSEDIKLRSYPGAARSRIDKLMHRLNKDKRLRGDTKVIIYAIGNSCPWQTEISHHAIRTFRKEGFRVETNGGFRITSEGLDNAFKRYETREGLNEKM